MGQSNNHLKILIMPDIKLTYFSLRARAEPARLMLAYAGVCYEDKRIPPPWEDPAGWKAKKATLAWGQLPILSWNGETIHTSLAIDRFLAKEFGLMGKNNVEAAQVDEVVDVLQDVFNAGATALFTKDEEQKKAAMEKHETQTVPNVLKMAEKRLIERGGQFMVGNAFTWADLQLYSFIIDNIVPVKLENLPKIADLVKRVGDLPNIKRWIENRPETFV